MIASIVICIIAELIGPLQFKVMGIDVKILTMIWVIIMGIRFSHPLLTEESETLNFPRLLAFSFSG